MTTNFTAHKPEEIVRVNITRKEALMVQEVRRHQYGKITIHKADGIIVRTEINISKLLDDKETLDRSLLV